MREPLDFYLSFYLWGVYYRQKEPASFGASFEEWARMVPNLQVGPEARPRRHGDRHPSPNANPNPSRSRGRSPSPSPNPNLQSTMLLHSMSAGDAEYKPRSYKRKYGLPHVSPQH